MKRVVLSILILLLLPASVCAWEIRLDIPINPAAITTVRMPTFNNNSGTKTITYSISMGYENAGVWSELRTLNQTVDNLQGAYDLLQDQSAATGKTPRRLIFEELSKSYFKGIIIK